jgi:hypothetical protein
MKFVILVFLLALFIAFVVVVVKSAKNTRWYQITSAVMTMLLAIIFLFPTAGVLKSRQAWNEVAEKLENDLRRVEEDHERILRGDPGDPTAPEGLESLSAKLSKMSTEAGRRWPGLTMVGGGNGAITLQLPAQPAVPGQEPAAASTEPLVEVGMVVYGFREGAFPGIDETVPTFYLGEFKVTASQPNSVTIVPSSPLDQRQAAAVSGAQGKWSLYELLPLDGHEPFVAEGSKPDDDNILGRVDDKLVDMLFKNASPEARQRYLLDGSKSDQVEDQAARWVKIAFDKKFTVDVDAKSTLGALEGGFFDESGRAVDGRLQRDDDGNIAFAVGDTIVLKEEGWKDLVEPEGVASVQATYYLRPLNDYRSVLRNLRLQIRETRIRIETLEYEKKILVSAGAATNSTLVKVQIEKDNLEKDLSQHQVENTALRTYFDKIREKLRQTKEASSALYRSNLGLMRQIESLSMTASLTET